MSYAAFIIMVKFFSEAEIVFHKVWILSDDAANIKN